MHPGQSQRSWAGIHQWALVGAETWPGTASAWSLSSFCSQPVVNRALLPVQPHHAHFSASMSLTSREKPVQVLAASRLCSQCVPGQKASLPALHLAKPRPPPLSVSWTPSQGSRAAYLYVRHFIGTISARVRVPHCVGDSSRVEVMATLGSILFEDVHFIPSPRNLFICPWRSRFCFATFFGPSVVIIPQEMFIIKSIQLIKAGAASVVEENSVRPAFLHDAVQLSSSRRPLSQSV